jgi:O-antigen/teichoic acid export membrane protein
MGKIKSQGIVNTIWTYFGIAAGGVYSIFIIPRAFAQNPEYWGLVQFMVYYMQVFLPLAQLGMPNTIIRFFSKTKTRELPNFYAFIVTLTFFVTLIVSILYFQFGASLANAENRELFTGHYVWLIPMLIGASFFETFSAISKAGLKSKVPVFLKESFPKLYTLVLITSYWLIPFSFKIFLILYSAIYILQFIIMLGYLIAKFNFRLSFSSGFFSSTLVRQMYPYMFLSVFVTSTALWSVKIDILMIGYMIDLQQVAYYSIALYMATLIIIPFRSMSSIATPMVAGYWTNNQQEEINTVLKKVSEISLVVGSFIFLALWYNIEWIMHILGNKFGDIKWVFFVIGLSRLIDSMFSINGGVILTSKYYKIDFIFQSVLVITSILLNFWLIPLYHLEGAALATLIALIIYNLMKWVFLVKKFKFSPFSRSTSIALILLVGLIVLAKFNPLQFAYWTNAFISVILLVTVYLMAIYKLNLSGELRQAIDKITGKFTAYK